MKNPCPYFRQCSGCTRLPFPYVKQLRDKQELVRERLAPFLGPDGRGPVLHDIVPSPTPLAYRSSTKLCLNEDDFGRRAIGLYERGTRKVVAIPGCPVHHPEINRLVERLFGPKAPPPPAPFYAHGRRGFQPGRLKFLTVRFFPPGGGLGVVVSHTGVAREDLEAWTKALRLPELSLYEVTLSRADHEQVLPATPARHLAGPERLPLGIGEQVFELTPLAFFQANAALTPRFVEQVVAELSGTVLLDLYGGFGAYSFTAAPHFQKAYVVDLNPEAVDAARRRALGFDAGRVEPIQASVEELFARKPAWLREVTHVIVNPPRVGLSSTAVDHLGSRLPLVERLTYVSCNLETLARDLRELTRRGGFRVEAVQPFDMFPQTDHLELVVRLTKKPVPHRSASSQPSS